MHDDASVVVRAYIDGDMAHDGCVVGQSDVLGIVLVVVALGRAGLLVIDNEGALDINQDIAWMLDCVLDVALHRLPTRASQIGRRRRGRVCRPHTRRFAGALFGRRQQHGGRVGASWLQPRSLAAMAPASGVVWRWGWPGQGS